MTQIKVCHTLFYIVFCKIITFMDFSNCKKASRAPDIFYPLPGMHLIIRLPLFFNTDSATRHSPVLNSFLLLPFSTDYAVYESSIKYYSVNVALSTINCCTLSQSIASVITSLPNLVSNSSESS